MFTPAIRAILYPSSAPQGEMPYLVARKSRAKRKTDARTNAPPETGETGCSADRIGLTRSQAEGVRRSNAGKAHPPDLRGQRPFQGRARADRDRRGTGALSRQHRDDRAVDQRLEL